MSHKLRKIILLLIFIAAIVLIIKIQFFPFGLLEKKLLPNTSISTYHVDIKINNKQDFSNFLKNNQEEYELGSFMDANGYVNWEEVISSIIVYRMGWKKIYSFEYQTLDPQCNKYQIDMTSDGYIRDYRSAGE